MNIKEKLLKIQQELKVPKTQFNSFGKYKYRSCEDILEAVKTVAHTKGCFVTLGDVVVEKNGKSYIEATATLHDTESGETLEVTAIARESQSKKGMDDPQMTGTASSYARKYALNGLFSIDDTKDSDTLNTSEDFTAERSTTKQYNCSVCNKVVPIDIAQKSMKANNAVFCSGTCVRAAESQR